MCSNDQPRSIMINANKHLSREESCIMPSQGAMRRFILLLTTRFFPWFMDFCQIRKRILIKILWNDLFSHQWFHILFNDIFTRFWNWRNQCSNRIIRLYNYRFYIWTINYFTYLEWLFNFFLRLLLSLISKFIPSSTEIRSVNKLLQG